MWHLKNEKILKYDGVVVDAVDKDSDSKFNLRLQYGPTLPSWWGKRAYIFTEVSGEVIDYGEIVATYVKINDVDYTYNTGGFFGFGGSEKKH